MGELERVIQRQASGATPALKVDVASMTGGGDASAAKQDAQTALLTSMDTDTGILAAMSQARSAVVAANHPSIMLYGVRRDSLATIDEAATEAAPILVDEFGRVWTVRGDASSALVDGVHLGLPSTKTLEPGKYLRVTTASAGVDLWDPTLDYIGVRWLTVTWQGAAACRITIWQGANADTTFTDGTDRVLFDIDLDANANGGVRIEFPADSPWETTTADHELHLTTSANKVVSVQVGGYERD